MIGRLLDKLVFGAALIFALQMPLLVDHYHQYLSGLYSATKWQVDGYEATAKAHQFADVNSMIDNHLKNAEPSVRTDAEQKLQTVELLQELTSGMEIFAHGNLLEKMVFMLHPDRVHVVKEVLQNFKVGIPLNASGLLFAVVLALLLNMLIMLPFRLMRSDRRADQY
ncbi:DUF2937 family protein [Rheinheimera soli]|uniref:DUF2937 family protein n=1 Tax=Rheinheimera soli TaxID=443616 RepID=A0ABU1W4T6_9GAMM|nr:DUF2937 family protein [Rheinheimera soli]MDR7122989.1 hypothetical protein [Rheinheimera soli]